MQDERRSLRFPSGLCILHVALLLLLLFPRPAAADSTTTALVNHELDMPAKLVLAGTLPQAMQQIGNATGVPMEADASVWDLLPWGEETSVNATIEGHPLREALTAITRKLGLEWSLTSDGVRLSPMPALRRLGRRSTLQELATLDVLASTPLASHPTSQPAKPPTSVRRLLDDIDNQLQQMHAEPVVENQADDAAQATAVSVPRGATLADALDAIARQTDCTWYPWGRTIVVLPKREVIRAQLLQRVSARYDGADVGQVLLDLFSRAGVNYSIEPGCYARIPADQRHLRLILDQATVQQALESIGGYTGLSFDVTDDGVRVSTAAPPSTAPAD